MKVEPVPLASRDRTPLTLVTGKGAECRLIEGRPALNTHSVNPLISGEKWLKCVAFLYFAPLNPAGPRCFVPCMRRPDVRQRQFFAAALRDPTDPFEPPPPLPWAVKERSFYQVDLRDKLAACLRPFSKRISIFMSPLISAARLAPMC